MKVLIIVLLALGLNSFAEDIESKEIEGVSYQCSRDFSGIQSRVCENKMSQAQESYDVCVNSHISTHNCFRLNYGEELREYVISNCTSYKKTIYDVCVKSHISTHNCYKITYLDSGN